VTNAVNAGVTFVVAAGNENQNACNVSPARACERDCSRFDDERRCAFVVLELRNVR
jgi:subtilisin family serine protease